MEENKITEDAAQEESTSPKLELPQSVIEQREKEAVAMGIAATLSSELVKNNSNFTMLVSSMLASRQLYAMCLHEMDAICGDPNDLLENFPELLKEMEEKGVEPDEGLLLMVKEILINAAAVQAQAPFEDKILFEGMVGSVLPWMKKVCAEHSAVQEEAMVAANKEAEVKRINSRINLLHEDQVDRETSYLIVGNASLVYFVLHLLSQDALDGNKSNVFQQFRLHADKYRLVIRDSRVCYGTIGQLSPNAQKPKITISDMYHAYESQFQSPMDLLIVDDIQDFGRNAGRTGLASFQTTINETQKELKRFAKTAGSLLISGVPMEEGLQTKAYSHLHSHPDWEVLRVHNRMRVVMAEEVESGFEVWLGTTSLGVFSREDIEAHRPKLIINP